MLSASDLARRARALALGLALLAMLTLAGCAAPRLPAPAPAPTREPYPAPPTRAQTPAPTPAPAPQAARPAPEPQPSPRALASLTLGEQGRQLLASGQVDGAISTLERACALNPQGWRNYYWLAEAWLAKGDLRQAREYNRLAALHQRGQAAEGENVAAQRRRIEGGGG